MVHKENILPIPPQLAPGIDAGEQLQWLSATFPGQVCFSTSFGVEDQVLTHIIASANLPIRFFTLDTGRLFPETYSTWSATLERYNTAIETFYPQAEALQQFVTANGPNSFYESVENRKACCHLRKVEPLQRALKGYTVWVTGIRAAQSTNREDMPAWEYDEANNIYKFHPLLHWSNDEVWRFVKSHQVPVNPLHQKGFVSIGCQPCTRAVRPGEDFRAGRWWWEDATKKECGLHTHDVTDGFQKTT